MNIETYCRKAVEKNTNKVLLESIKGHYTDLPLQNKDEFLHENCSVFRQSVVTTSEKLCIV